MSPMLRSWPTGMGAPVLGTELEFVAGTIGVVGLEECDGSGAVVTTVRNHNCRKWETTNAHTAVAMSNRRCMQDCCAHQTMRIKWLLL